MPFGRHKGEPLSRLPDEYLDWLTTIDLRPRLHAGVYAEIRRRGGADFGRSAPGSALLACPEPAIARELVGAGLRNLARRYHPDAGGANKDMVRVTSAADWLRAVIEGGTP